MKHRLYKISLFIWVLPLTCFALPIEKTIQAEAPALFKIYKGFHQNPELSNQETRTAKILARYLKKAGFKVKSHVSNHGVIAYFQNGKGPTLMIRAELDALPLKERTNLPFASHVQSTKNGKKVGVMHACGHDVHLTTAIGLARLFKHHQKLWRGTLVIVGQPAEEIGRGAKALLSANFLKHLPQKPDAILGLHVSAHHAIGTVVYSPGWTTAHVQTLGISITGRGGHAAMPHLAKNPIYAAAELTTQLEKIAATHHKYAALSLGQFSGGTKSNIIPKTTHLKLSLRTFSKAQRNKVIKAIKDQSAGIAKKRNVQIKVNDGSTGTSAGYNDPSLSTHLSKALIPHLGKKNIMTTPPVFFGDDFSEYYQQTKIPAIQFAVGSISPKRFKATSKLPSLHSPRYYPDMPGTLTHAMRTMGHYLIYLFKKL